MASLIEKAFGKIIGADVMCFGWQQILDQVAAEKYLEGCMAEEGEPVQGFAFASYNMYSILELGDGGSDVFAMDES